MLTDESPDVAAFRAEVRTFVQAHLPQDIAQKCARGLHLEKEDYLRWERILREKGWFAAAWPKDMRNGLPSVLLPERYSAETLRTVLMGIYSENPQNPTGLGIRELAQVVDLCHWLGITALHQAMEQTATNSIFQLSIDELRVLCFSTDTAQHWKLLETAADAVFMAFVSAKRPTDPRSASEPPLPLLAALSSHDALPLRAWQRVMGLAVGYASRERLFRGR